MKNICLLTDIKIGQTAVVESLCAKSGIRRRLQDIGLIEGTKIKCILKSPFNDPAAFIIRGAVIALRSEDSDTVIVSY